MVATRSARRAKRTPKPPRRDPRRAKTTTKRAGQWKIGCIVPLYKGKGDPLECKNHRGKSLLSVPGKVYGRILIERVIENSERQIGEEQSGFRKGRSCADQIFVLIPLL